MVRKKFEEDIKAIVLEATNEIENILVSAEKRSSLKVLQERQKSERDAFQARIKGLENANELLAQYDEAQREEMARSEQDVREQFVDIYGQYTDDIIALRDELNVTQDSARQSELQSEITYLEQLADLEKKLAEVRLQTAELSSEERLQAEKLVQQEITALAREGAAERGEYERGTIGFIIERFKELKDRAKEVRGEIKDFLKAMKEGGEEADEAIEDLIDKIKEISVLDILDVLGKITNAIGVFGKMVTKTLVGIIGVFNDLLATLTCGFTINHFQLVQENH